MSAFGKVLGATFAVVLVSKVGLTVAFHADAKHAEQAQVVVNTINNNTSALAEPFSNVVAVKEGDTADIVLNYTLKPGFVEDVQQMADTEVQRKTLNTFDNTNLKQIINDGATVVIKFRSEDGQLVKNVIISQENLS